MAVLGRLAVRGIHHPECPEELATLGHTGHQEPPIDGVAAPGRPRAEQASGGESTADGACSMAERAGMRRRQKQGDEGATATWSDAPRSLASPAGGHRRHDASLRDGCHWDQTIWRPGYLSVVITTPMVISATPTIALADMRSPRKLTAKIAVSTTLSLSTGATTDAGPACRARK